MTEHPYELLGITPAADDRAVQRAYAEAVARHRDRRQQISAARQQLMRNRLEHDMTYLFPEEGDPAEALGLSAPVDFLDPELLPAVDVAAMLGPTEEELRADHREPPPCPVPLPPVPPPDPDMLPELPDPLAELAPVLPEETG